MITTVMFDLGGVVLTRGLWLLRRHLVQHYGVTEEDSVNHLIKKHYTRFFSGGMTEQEFWKNALNDMQIQEDWHEMRRKLLEFFQPQEGMLELIDSLRDNGYTTVLLSDQTKEWWRALDEKYRISPHFNTCIISAEVGAHKPSRKIYDIALERSDSTAGTTVFIDDREDNVQAAEQLGIRGVLFQDVASLKERLASYGITL